MLRAVLLITLLSNQPHRITNPQMLSNNNRQIA